MAVRWLAAAATIGLVAPAAAAESGNGSGATVDLVGTWFVVMHYRDSATANPDVDRWEDRLWSFEPKGSRLNWTEYSIVVFEDKTGRFERRGKNARARTLQAWMPNEAQRLEIEAGPQVNTRGSKTKSLRGSAEKGYESAGALRAQSAMTIGYHESWRIEDPSTLPVFVREDVMGTGRSHRAGGQDQSLEGVTRYATEEVVDADTLRGSYVRDDNKKGTFVMMRSGSARSLETDGRTPNEKLADEVREQIQAGQQEYFDDLMERMKAGDESAARELRELREDLQRQRSRER